MMTQILRTDYTDPTRRSGYPGIRDLGIRISGDPDHLVPGFLIAGYPYGEKCVVAYLGSGKKVDFRIAD